MRSPGRSRVFGLTLGLGLALLLLACAEPPEREASISRDELARRIHDGTAPLILDVRTEQEYRAGHIPGSVNIPHDQLAERLPELGISESDEIVVHCEGGRRAAMAESVLVEAGYSRVRDLEGQMKGWREAGLASE